MKVYNTVCFMQGFTINHAHKDIMFADGIFSVDLVRRKLKCINAQRFQFQIGNMGQNIVTK